MTVRGVKVKLARTVSERRALCFWSVLLTLVLGVVRHLQVHLESAHLLCSDGVPEAGLSYK